MVTNIFIGAVNEIGNFEYGKLVIHGYKKCVKAILTKVTSSLKDTNHAWLQNFAWGRSKRKWQFYNWETNHSRLHNFAYGDLSGNEKLKTAYSFDLLGSKN